MPVLLVKEVEWDGEAYSLSLEEVSSLLPHLRYNDSLTISILEIRNERNKPIVKFKPLKRIKKIVITYYAATYKRSVTCLRFRPSEAAELNIANNYRIVLLIIEHNGRPILPLELKPIGYEAEDIVHTIEKIEPILISITQPELQETVDLLLQASMFESEGRTEDVRTYLRKSLEALTKIRKKIKPEPGKETEDFGRRLENLIRGIRGFVDYGGPHLGPAPRFTTRMVFNMIIELVKMLAHNIAEGTLTISGDDKQNDC